MGLNVEQVLDDDEFSDTVLQILLRRYCTVMSIKAELSQLFW